MKEPTTKSLRAYTGDYALLKELSESLSISMAEALRRAISEDLTVLKEASHKEASLQSERK